MQQDPLVAPMGVPTEINRGALTMDNAPNAWKQRGTPYSQSLDNRVRVLDDANR
jgi:hypothetical protein